MELRQNFSVGGYLKMDEKLMLKHLELVSNTSVEAKSAILTYSYNNNEKDKEYYNPKDMNIGDYIQSLAAAQFLPKSCDTFIDRDFVSSYQGDNVNIFLNAWWYLWKKNKSFSQNIRPLFVSFHLNNYENTSVESLEYLKAHQPIGCRDYKTRDFLLEHGIEAYFSGCMTLTLGETFKVDESERENKVYFVDYNIDWFRNKEINKALKSVLEKYKNCEFFKLTHIYPKSSDIKGCFSEAQSLIKRYAKARLVITTRIHCALPCIALGTPVILITRKFDKKRFKGLISFLNFIGKDIEGNFTFNVAKDDNGFVYNNDNYLKYRDYLVKISKAFVKNPETSIISESDASSFKYHQKPVKINKKLKFFFI